MFLHVTLVNCMLLSRQLSRVKMYVLVWSPFVPGHLLHLLLLCVQATPGLCVGVPLPTTKIASILNFSKISCILNAMLFSWHDGGLLISDYWCKRSTHVIDPLLLPIKLLMPEFQCKRLSFKLQQYSVHVIRCCSPHQISFSMSLQTSFSIALLQKVKL